MGDITRVGVVGAGLMGSGIAEVTAKAGIDVVVVETDATAAEVGRTRIEKSLARGVEKGKLSADDRAAALARMTFTTDLAACADRDLVLEAVAENEAVKLDVFGKLDTITRADAVLASNTSSLPITRLAMATSRPEQVVGLHFFNPVPVQQLVELIPSLLTSERTAEKARSFASDVLGKTVVNAPDRAGFVVNALLIPYLLSAIRMVEAGYATAEDIDNGMVLGCAHPMGPLRLADLIGLDTTQAIAESMYAEYKEPSYAPPPLLRRMTEAGHYGRKSGRGFYDYPRGD